MCVGLTVKNPSDEKVGTCLVPLRPYVSIIALNREYPSMLHTTDKRGLSAVWAALPPSPLPLEPFYHILSSCCYS